MAATGKRAAGLWGIILFKLGKGLMFLMFALSLFSLTDNNIPEEFRKLVRAVNMDPERQFWSHIADQLAKITPKGLVWFASSTVLYASISLLESVGLMFRQRWAGWLAIAEGAFFIPIEIFELSRHFRIGLFAILIINCLIVAYLYRNRERLFKH